MNYIGGIDVDENNKVKLKRISNKKWYDGLTLLKQIKDHLNNIENGKAKNQFISEYNEIIRAYLFFGIEVDKKLKYNQIKKGYFDDI